MLSRLVPSIFLERFQQETPSALLLRIQGWSLSTLTTTIAAEVTACEIAWHLYQTNEHPDTQIQVLMESNKRLVLLLEELAARRER